ncbi:LOW QUALITY PROTEIN: hypothetical protein Cgig2_009941 [Carnegiea gigantea]|uniref:Uncharacterized protein n=1 Tax=Carnegiea gigantea TaxID=171969 RepID=A0A9Q1K0P5_9CARY|nr:LOW QUALITY PROTEIN: hypothetical protein Cgig2_009941 [Carnegiea gigantea]
MCWMHLETHWKPVTFTIWVHRAQVYLNGQEGDWTVEEILDRYCASPDWSAMFPSATVTHVDNDISDHLPILLRRRRRRRRFENMWVLDDRCADVIQDVWSQNRSSDLIINCMEKIECCMEALTTWNQEVFGHVQVEAEASLIRVADLTDRENGNIKTMPLCTSWPSDRLMWHYSHDGFFSVKTAYHFIQNQKSADLPTSSRDDQKAFWADLWSLDILPKMKMFAWRAAVRALQTNPRYDIKCNICGGFEESDKHALFDCVVAQSLWEESRFDRVLWDSGLGLVLEIFMAAKMADGEGHCMGMLELEERLAFGRQVARSNVLAKKAMELVREFYDAQVRTNVPTSPQQITWKPPCSSLFKTNFDSAQFGDWGFGLGAEIRDSSGMLLVAGKVQATGVLTEAQACLFAMDTAWEQGYSPIVIEGDSLSLVSKLKKRRCPNNELGLLISDILAFAGRFDFCSFVHVKRTENRVAYTLVWLRDGLDQVLDLVLEDICNNVSFS